MKQSLFFFTTIMLAVSAAAQAPVMVHLTGGSFQMGSESGGDDEKPVHQVTVSAFSIGKYEVTVAEYKAFCKATNRSMPDPPAWGWLDHHPMMQVSYNDAVAYCRWLAKETGKPYRLPTEAEWEYAARGGASANESWAGSNQVEQVAWYKENSGGQTHEIGTKMPNAFGLYDLCGNVWEWCSDRYDKAYYAFSESLNPKGPEAGTTHVLRGGSWNSAASSCRVAYRDSGTQDTRLNRGFRVVWSD